MNSTITYARWNDLQAMTILQALYQSQKSFSTMNNRRLLKAFCHIGVIPRVGVHWGWMRYSGANRRSVSARSRLFCNLLIIIITLFRIYIDYYTKQK